MKSTYSRKAEPFQAVFGFKSSAVLPYAWAADNCVTLHTGWITLYFGRDAAGIEFVLAGTAQKRFLLCVNPPRSIRAPKLPGRNDWVFAINYHPGALLRGSTSVSMLSCCGFAIQLAQDRHGRDYAFVEMPGGELKLLIRDPATQSSKDWRPRKTDEVCCADECASIGATPEVLQDAFDGSGDRELDHLLASLA